MEIEVKNENGEALIRVTGCLDTAAAPDFKRAIDALPAETKKVTFDFANLEFIASSALRVLVALGKRLDANAKCVAISGSNEVVRDVFEMTGLVEVFNVL